MHYRKMSYSEAEFLPASAVWRPWDDDHPNNKDTETVTKCKIYTRASLQFTSFPDMQRYAYWQNNNEQQPSIKQEEEVYYNNDSNNNNNIDKSIHNTNFHYDYYNQQQREQREQRQHHQQNQHEQENQQNQHQQENQQNQSHQPHQENQQNQDHQHQHQHVHQYQYHQEHQLQNHENQEQLQHQQQKGSQEVSIKNKEDLHLQQQQQQSIVFANQYYVGEYNRQRSTSDSSVSSNPDLLLSSLINSSPPSPKSRKRGTRRNISNLMNKECYNCGTRTTSLWRYTACNRLSCNACGLYLQRNKCSRPAKLIR